MKAFYDKNAPTKNLVTTITGIILLVVTILGSLGVLTPEQSTEVQTQAGVVIGAVVQIISAVSALILMFRARD
jgi:hypothetical protein